jgi:hypothetical protein
MLVLDPSISETRLKSIPFPVPPDTGADVTPALREVLTELAKQGGGRIEFAPGRYDFRLDRAIEKYLFVSNNDEGLKRIAFHLEGLSEVEIDGQGAQQVRAQFPDAVGIFILPPSVAALEQRLRKRGQDNEEVIAKRVRAAAGEIAHAGDFDYVIINDNFETALSELASIAQSARCRVRQQAARHDRLFADYGIQPDSQ